MMELNEPYLRQDFTDFLNDFLPDFEKDVRKTNFESLGATDEVAYLGKSKKLNIQVFELIHKASPNARVALATDGFRIMKQSASFRALIAYRSDEVSDWRLSLMTLTPEPNEQGNVSVKFSNPRRFSFFLGPNAKVNTPYKFLIKKGEVADFEDLKSRFSLEVVNKEFYQEIAELYTKLVGGARGKGKKERKYKGIIELPSVASGSRTNHEFAVRLIGRIIFCWFLREKKSESGLALVPKELLSLGSAKATKDFYHSTLEPLFFEVLNKQVKSRKEQYAKDFYAQIPYLNGGLFSPQEDDYYSFNEGKQGVNHNTVKIPDKWLVGLFEVLELYNFTIDENTSVDIDLSIDPEMLGRIFENLLAEINPETGESARKSTGSYYTPRTIVEYMVDESLYQYLKQKTEIEEKKLRALSSYDLSDDEKYPLTQDEKKKVIEALSTITILDPACGSGAFPIGALQKIVFILQRVDPDAKLWFQKQITITTPEVRRLIEHEFKHKNFDYIRKLGVIRKSIFGVDIQPIATEISRLRCFLTLVVDESINDDEPNRGVVPLPNLEFKFVTANSLIGLPKTDAPQRALFDNYQKIDELKSIRDQYFNASGIEREQLKTEFATQQTKLLKELQKEHGWTGVAKAELTQKLTDWEPFTHKPSSWFDPEWMFGIKGGFDIVIANPPYVNVKRAITADEKEKYKSLYQSATGQFDLFALFIEKGLSLTRDVISYIVPKPFINNENYESIRKITLSFGINKLIVGSKVFEAGVESCILFTSKLVPSSEIVVVIYEDGRFRPKNLISKNFISTLPFNIISTEISNVDERIIAKICAPEVLEDVVNLTRGAECGKNDQCISDTKTSYRLVTGKDLTRYRINHRNLYINFDTNDTKKFKELSLYQGDKILVRRVANKLISTYDNSGYIVLNTIYCGKQKGGHIDLKFIVAVLNSKLIQYWFHKVFVLTDTLFPYVRQSQLGLIPIKRPDYKGEGLFTEITDNIFVLTNSSDYLENLGKQSQVKEYEKQIDQMVYKLYNLTPEEIEIVEESTQ